MPRYFALADVMLVTLKDEAVFSRTIPSKVQSYLACSRPVVAALNGEGAQVITDSGAGIAVGAGNAQGLADAVARLYAMPSEERDAMGRRGRCFFEEEFTADKLISSLESMMHEVKEEGLCES
jgi:glycosyltransferase involved in cell wall biosynthesis